ncbi:MAG: PAS domain S-box protein, partial [Myxococcales bacterium]|nr:PAS domain S-box protein [Myxococcales bacterium]
MGREDDIAQRDEPDVVPPSTTETSATESAAAGDDLYRAVFNLNSAIKLLIDASTGAIIDANDAAVEFYGWSREELAGMRISDINTLTPDEVEAELANANSGARRHFRFRHRTAKGDIRHVEVHSGPVPLNGRNVLLSIIHDVTDRDALEWQLRQAQRLEMVGQLAGTVAHEFNNLLTVMVGALSSLERRLAQTQVEGSTRVPLRDLSFAIERAEQLTHGLLAFSRRQTSEPRELDVNQVTQSLIELLRRSIKPRLHIRLELASALPPIQGDPHQIEAILMNLVLNARHAMLQRSGSVRNLRIVARRHGSHALIEVSDTGCGIDPEFLPHIFKTFVSGSEGTGLGLAISR